MSMWKRLVCSYKGCNWQITRAFNAPVSGESNCALGEYVCSRCNAWKEDFRGTEMPPKAPEKEVIVLWGPTLEVIPRKLVAVDAPLKRITKE
jgi:hypothetical protein